MLITTEAACVSDRHTKGINNIEAVYMRSVERGEAFRHTTIEQGAWLYTFDNTMAGMYNRPVTL